MGVFDKFERTVEGAINGIFSRAFKAEVQPVEIASAIRRAMDDRASVVNRGRTVVPNIFTIELSFSDYDRITQDERSITEVLMASAAEHAEQQRFVPGGPFHVSFKTNENLETGVFNVRSSMAKTVPSSHTHSSQAAPEQPAAAQWEAPVQAADEGYASGHSGHVLPPEYAPQQQQPTAEPSYAAEAYPSPAAQAPAYPAAEQQHSSEGGYSAYSAGDAGAQGYNGSAGAAAAAGVAGAAAGAAASQASGYGYDPAPAEQVHDPYVSSYPSPAEQPQPYAGASGYQDPYAAPQQSQSAAPAASPYASMDPSSRPWLTIDGDTYPLMGAITIIGRDAAADITLSDAGISRQHCEFRTTHDGPHLVVTVRDLGSTNGTFVNGDPIDTMRVSHGDRVTVGRTSMVINIHGR